MKTIAEKPKIKVEFNLGPHEQSEVLGQIRDFVLNLSSAYANSTNDEVESDQEFIPEEDQETPDLEIDETEAPLISEGDGPKDESSGVRYVRLGDLLKSNL